MVQSKKFNIKKEIIIEKCNFISNNSTYLNSTIKENLATLKSILLNSAPLSQCDGYQELIEEIKQAKIKNITHISYQNSIEILFTIVYSILHNTITNEKSKREQIEKIRQYVKCVSTLNSGNIYYHRQKIISIDNEKLNMIKKTK